MPLLPVLLTALLATTAAAASPIRVGATRHLFLDDELIESTTNVRREVQQARKFEGNPVLRPTEPWEGNVALLYGSVLREGGRYRMWYMNSGAVAYAESADGITWTKPDLGIVTIDGRATNLVHKTGAGCCELPFYRELMGVVRDDLEEDPTKRYKMGYISIHDGYSGPSEDPFHRGQRRGLGIAVSPDGIRWTSVDPFATEATCDGLSTWMLDSCRDRYVLYGRSKQTLPEVDEAWSKFDWYKKWHWGRSVMRAESVDLIEWSHTTPVSAPVVMSADAKDEPGTEIYSLMVFPYESVYIGLVQAFVARPDASYLELQLAVSHDSVRFERVGDRKAFIPVGPVGSWDRFNQSPANNPPLEVGDELRFYYAGRTYRHGPYDGPDKGVSGSAIGFASIKRDRFVALESSFEGGEIITKPLAVQGGTLHINAKSDFGEIRVEAIDPGGRVVARSRPVAVDSLDIPVEWEEGALPDPGVPVRLRMTLKNALLSALWSS